MTNPIVSIIVPVYNVGTFIEDCIKSILSQSFEEFELIIIDDGSTDDSLRICKDYKIKDSRIIILEIPHKGVAKARNRGIEEAKGEFVTFIDGDDMIHPDYLKSLYTIIRQYKADIVTCENIRVEKDFTIDKIKNLKIKKDLSYNQPTVISLSNIYKNLFDDINYMTVCRKFYKRSIINNQRFKDFALGEDTEFNSRVFSFSKLTIHLSSPLYFYRNRPNSTVTSKFNLNKLDNVRSCYAAYNNIKQNNSEYGHFALIRLYKNMLSLNYNSTAECKHAVKVINKNISDNINHEFLKNRKITPTLKFFLISSVKFPIIYKWFRHFKEWKSN